MKSKLLIIISMVFLIGCERQCASQKRKWESGENTYVIEMYSGGEIVFKDSATTIINMQDGGNAYYYKGDSLIELSGDYVLRSISQ